MLVLFLIVLPLGHGFLLDNPHGNVGQSLPANQYLTISKFVEETNLLQQKVETDTTSLRHYTDTSLALLTAQLQQKFDLIEAKITDKVAQNDTSQALVTLQQKYQALEKNYQNLIDENGILQRRIDFVESEFLMVKNKTVTNELFLKEQTHFFSDLEMHTNSKIQQLSNNHNISFSNMENRMYRLNNDTIQSHNTSMIFLERSLDLQLKNFEKNQSKAFDEIARDMQETKKRTNVALTGLQKQLDDSTDLVVMTAQPVSASTKPGIIKFDAVKFSIGINDLSTYRSTGKFTCETGGIYLISASIMSDTNGAFYYIYLNGIPISETYIGYSTSAPSSMYNSGTVVLARQLHPNDSVWVESGGNNYIYNGVLSTLTIVKVK